MRHGRFHKGQRSSHCRSVGVDAQRMEGQESPGEGVTPAAAAQVRSRIGWRRGGCLRRWGNRRRCHSRYPRCSGASEASARGALATTEAFGEGTVWESLRILERADWIASDGLKASADRPSSQPLGWAAQKLDRSTRKEPVEGSQMLLSNVQSDAVSPAGRRRIDREGHPLAGRDLNGARVRVGGSGEVAHRIESQWVGESILCVTQLCRAVALRDWVEGLRGDGRKSVGRTMYIVWNRPPICNHRQQINYLCVTPQSR